MNQRPIIAYSFGPQDSYAPKSPRVIEHTFPSVKAACAFLGKTYRVAAPTIITKGIKHGGKIYGYQWDYADKR